MTVKLMLGMLLAVWATGLQAEALEVGQDAPKFKAGGTLINPPEFARELDDCKGDVILIYEWHIRDGTANGLTAIQQYWDKWGGRGLKVFTIHRLDFEKWPQVEAYCRNNKYTMPVAMGGFYDDKNEFFGYKAGKNFRTTVVGIDGKVAYYGKDDGWKAAMDAELAKLVYPNLGKHSVAEDVEKAAGYLAERDFGKAINEAEKLLAGELSDDGKADAELVIERAKAVAIERNKRIDAWIEDKRYDLAMTTLELIKEEFKGNALGDEAYDRIKELKKDKAAKKELKSFELLDKLIAKDGGSDPLTFVNSLRTFARTQHGFRAAEVAESMAKNIENVLDD
ncbi:MAG: hypothetical protein KDB32_09895 [Planctomycetes bacterium]|nr:hypothetical protein [Planctomycetota bacterium]MCA8946468.1 hypothetical protein [Planctomycetota bacterium]